MPIRLLLFAVSGFFAATGIVLAADRPTGPLSPAGELQTFRLADPRLSIELVAAEPDLVSPVAVCWNENLQMFVAEMIDYPAGPTAGRVRMLEDRDGDGHYENSTIFAAGLPFPTSVFPWGGGLLVAAAPDIIFFRDRDGDGKADERRVILTGFAEGNQQLRVNGLSMGLDNWIYGANGRSDGLIRRPQDPPEKAVLLRHRDFRFRPATGEVEAVAGFSQFGLPRDDWGNRFPSWNTVPFRHVVIEERVLSRNPYLAESTSVAEILDPQDGNRVFSISPPQVTFNREPVTVFNASCGSTIYRGDRLGDTYAGNAFVCESLTNLVHRRALVPAGPTFSARRVEQNREFLASTDPAFRPVNLATGPDGAFYVIDFYREMVEHPQFVPQDVRSSVNFRKWNDRGRIWRIRPSQPDADRKKSPPTRLGPASTAELITLLGHPNGWSRDTAQRLLVERPSSPATVALLETAAQAHAPLARLHALWTLEGLHTLTDATVARALDDEHPGVREAAARLAIGRSVLVSKLTALADDPAMRVRFAVAIALGEIPGEPATLALAKIAVRDFNDEWMRLAVLSGLRETAWPFLKYLLLAQQEWLSNPPPSAALLLTQTASILGGRHRPDEVEALAASLIPNSQREPDHGRLALLEGLTGGLLRAGQSPRSLLTPPSAEYPTLARSTSALLDKARTSIESSTELPQARARALKLLAQFRPDSVASLIPGLLDPAQPALVQSAAAQAVANVASPSLVSAILDRWPSLAVATRRELLATLLSSPALATPLIDALATGTVAPSELDAAARTALDRLPDPMQRQRAATILAKAAPLPRTQVIQAFQSALSLPADTRRGAELFTKNCQTCHERQGKGHRVGPDLSSVASRPASALFDDILDPNHNLSPDYVNFLLVTKQGKVLSGLLVEETATSLKLKRADAAEETILRSEVDELRASGRSLMPEGLEQVLGVQGLADILAFLREP
jgi:putative membrane-bound dehydrogenase-like protein